MYHEKEMKINVVGVLCMVMALEYDVPKIKTCLPHFKHVLILGMSCSSHVLPYTYQFI
jgi:coenzyme F420-reducing hydrogenase beta subunit